MIALALGGGAGLGWAHIGVLRALEAHGVTVGAVAGTSIGALAAVCAAAGRLDVLEGLARSANIGTVLRYMDVTMRRGSVFGGRTIAHQLTTHLGPRQFSDLLIPCAAVAADLVSGREVVLKDGPVVDAVLASIAIPGIFMPVRRGDQLLVDGGVVAPVPVAAARSLAPGLPVIAVNLQNDYLRRAQSVGLRLDRRQHPSTVNVARAAMGLLLSRLARQSLTLDPPDLELALPVGHIDVRDFTRAHDLITIGREAVDHDWPAIAALLEARAARH